MEADDAKNAHLLALPGAAERLALCKADLLDYGALRAAVAGCHGVFHAASPVTDDPVRTPARVTYTALWCLVEYTDRDRSVGHVVTVRMSRFSCGLYGDVVSPLLLPQ